MSCAGGVCWGREGLDVVAPCAEELGQVLAVGRGKVACQEQGGVSNTHDSRTRGTNTQHSPRAAQKARKTHRGHPVLAAGTGVTGLRGQGTSRGEQGAGVSSSPAWGQ